MNVSNATDRLIFSDLTGMKDSNGLIQLFINPEFNSCNSSLHATVSSGGDDFSADLFQQVSANIKEFLISEREKNVIS